MKIKYNLPKKVKFCSKCVMSNQRPNSISEFFHTKDRKNAKYLTINEIDNVCDACKLNEIKNQLDWEEREKKLIKLLDTYKEKETPTLPIGADLLMSKFQIPEGKTLGNKLKRIEETWVQNGFQISDKQVQQIVKS